MSLLTRRIPTILGLVLVVVAVMAGIYYMKLRRPPVVNTVIPQKVRITNIADNKFSVSWVTDDPTQGLVEYGQVGEKLTLRKGDERDGATSSLHQTHHVSVEGLQPSTQYAFRILSGDKLTSFDNNGSPYTTATGPVIGSTPVSKNFYGSVALPSKQSPAGALVYVALPGASIASALVNEAGNYAVTMSTIRSSDLREYAKFDPAATIASVTVETGKQQTVASVSLANAAPVPTITLGQNVDFRNLAAAETAPDVPNVAEVVPQAETPSIFNVEPLSEENEINAVGTQTVTLLNPSVSGETLASLRPEFRGTGPKGITLSISVKGQKTMSDTTVVGVDGTWSYAPIADLKVGRQTVTIAYIGSGGSEQKIEREFIVSISGSGGDPAFVATPSGSIKPSAVPTASPRAAMPATESGVPVTGVVAPTLYLLLAGFIVVSSGLWLLL